MKHNPEKIELKNILDLLVNQIRIFPVDVVPINLINTKSFFEKVGKSLAMNEIGTLPSIDGKDSVSFRKGELKESDESIIINKIDIEPRRIIIEVAGTSKNANKVYERLLTLLKELSVTDLDSLEQPLLLAETTRCIAVLDFSFEEIFNNTFISFLENKVEKQASISDVAEVVVQPLAAIAEISYKIKSDVLINNRITMNSKQFTIAPRPGAPLSDRKYVISSPFDSDTHIKLVQTLNRSLVRDSK